MKTRLRQALASTLILSLLVACQGLAPYQALAGGLESQAPEAVHVDVSNAAPAAPSVALPGQGISDGALLTGLRVETGLQSDAAAAGQRTEAAGARAETVAEQAPQDATLRERLSAAPMGAQQGARSLIEAAQAGGAERKAAPSVDFDHAGALKTASLGVDAAGDKVSRAAAALQPARRFYAYETQRDYKITAAAKAAHFGSIGVKMAGKLWLMSLWNKTLAIVYGAAFLVVPPKLMVFLRLYSGIHLTLASPAIARHAPVFADRREVLQPHEELGQIPGVLRTIDVSDRHDSAEGFSYFGSFLNRRVEKHQTLVMTDRALPAEIRAQDGGLLGRLREIGADDTLVFRARTRVGAEVATWRRSVQALFAGDAMDAATAAKVRSGLDENWLGSTVVKLGKLLLFSVILGGAALLPLEHFGIAGAHTYAELVGLMYFIVAGVFDHSGGPRIFRKYFFLAEAPQASLWTRTKQFLAEAWHESKEHHAHAITVSLETAAGEQSLGDIARGAGTHAFAGNGLRRQIALNSPYILGLLALGVGSLRWLSTAALASSAWPLAAAAALGVSAALAYRFLVPFAADRARPGLSIRKHDRDGRVTALVMSVAAFGVGALALALAGQWLGALSSIAALAAVAFVLDPFTSKGAAAYDARARVSSIPWGQGAFILAAMVAALAFLPASSLVAGEALVATAAVLLASLYAGVKHIFNPPIRDVRTPRSTPELATRALSR